MKNVMKTATLESKFPLLAVENGCIISKDADITVAYRVELPELFTLTRAEYESMHSTWAKAVKILPNYSIVHKQDFFIEEGYKPDICKEDLSFLSRSFERHFNERPYLQHTCSCSLRKPRRNTAGQPAVSMHLQGDSLSPRKCRTRKPSPGSWSAADNSNAS